MIGKERQQEKILKLKDMIRKSINTRIIPKFEALMASLSQETSNQQLLHMATMVRNCRNALRYIKGKRIRSASRDARLTMRILETSSSPSLKSKPL